jgi:hypothetical protein
MATPVQIHSSGIPRGNDWITRNASPRTEALALFVVMKQKGESVESIRELIEVPAEIREKLMVFALMPQRKVQRLRLRLRLSLSLRCAFEREWRRNLKG